MKWQQKIKAIYQRQQGEKPHVINRFHSKIYFQSGSLKSAIALSCQDLPQFETIRPGGHQTQPGGLG
ncbi:MAG: hypothetical protein R2861_09860 [Desulfobacterales bacterium]